MLFPPRGALIVNAWMNALGQTIHGRSRYPGLYIWLRDGTKTPVKVPPGCLLLQAGIQFEWLTGGKVLAGFHEVVVSEGTLKAIDQRRYAFCFILSDRDVHIS